PNAIYLIPPKKEMIISGGRLLLTDKDPNQALNLPIDTFFRSLAQDCGSRAIGVVLSGTGSDGSRGILAIHDAGGLVVAQDDATAKFDGMPRAAMETGVVDFELPPEAIPDVLLDYVNNQMHSGHLESPDQPAVPEDGINAIYSLLRREYAIDFSHYKPSTVTRRIERRLQLNRSQDVDDYVAKLQSDTTELNLLYKDLLIGVTKFFRDSGAYDRLSEEVVPQMLSKLSDNEELRIWIAGCATGEEAYSIAIVIHEAIAVRDRQIGVKIFATDVHQASLEVASSGVYSEEAVSEVSKSRLDRYFSKRGNGYHVSQELRKMIVFAPHNVIKDAPFTKLDLVCCRNLLIYFQPHVQKKVLSLFHFGLKTGGALFLGPSESPGEIADEFETVDQQWKMFRKRRDVRLPADVRMPLSSGFARLRDSTLHAPATNNGLPYASLLRAYDALLAAHVPPSLLIDENHELVHAFSGAGKFLAISDGRSSTDILDLVVPDIRLALSGALQRAQNKGETVSYSGLVVRDGESEQQLRLSVRPITVHSTDEAYFLITLEDVTRERRQEDPGTEVRLDESSKERLVEVEDELRYTKENLQATIEEMETTNEELQATNEELVASNEELQSTNEELHSVNEELYTVNAEYQRKIVELTQLTDDVDNLLRSTDVGTIFLDRDMCIRKFTPKVAHAFQILPQDVGRPLESFSHNIEHPTLMKDVRGVLTTEQSFEKDVRDRRGNWYLLRILPYRSKDRVDGVVLTLIDIANLKAAQRELQRMSTVFMEGADPIVIEDLSGTIVGVNEEAIRAYHWSRDELIGSHVSILWPPENEQQARTLRERCKNSEHVRNVESARCDRDGRVHPMLLTLSLINDETGSPVGIATISKDISRLKQAEQKAQEEVRRRDRFLAMLSHELRNPLGAVMNAASILERGDTDEAATDKASEVVKRQSEQMARLLDDLLDVSRVTQDKIKIRREVVDLIELVYDAVQAVQPVISSRNHQLEVHADEEPLYVEGDAARLRQIQENLLTNAAKYTPPGGTITMSVVVRDGDAEITVRDTGEGIAQELQEKIFDLFVQGDCTLERSDGGMGVGLTLVRRLVELHNGSVVARSDGPGKGSEFVVRIPLTTKRPISADPLSVDLPSDCRVLIVEDNLDSREMLQSLLQLDGFEVVTAGDGQEGLDALEQSRPDVALIDIGLPGLDGYEVAKRVRKEFPQISTRLVALTGYGRTEDRQAVLEAGFDEHLVKPVQAADLARVLRKPR
ncbi:MAG: PAS domain-containing protein, partial [Pirellulales bacterium]|nr:PAS domain-containing protein [Pirellulales bacterium]